MASNTTISEELVKLINTKAAIKQALIDKGQTPSDFFNTYALDIENISGVKEYISVEDMIEDIDNIGEGEIAEVDGNIYIKVTKSGTSTMEELIITSDATATTTDIATNKTAYVNGEKITGSVNVLQSGITTSDNFTLRNVSKSDPNHVVKAILDNNQKRIIEQGCGILAEIPYNRLASAIYLSSDILKKDEVVLGITGTYDPGMKEYNSEAAMNNDINNIKEGEVVKVIISGVTTFYVKEGDIVEQTVDLTQYQVGDVFDLGNKKVLKTLDLKTQVSSGSSFGITLLDENHEYDPFVVDIIGTVRDASGTITVDEDYSYNYTITDQRYCELSDNDVEEINSRLGYLPSPLIITRLDATAMTGLFSETVKVYSMKKLVKEEDTISPEEYEDNIETLNDILGEEV